MKFIGQALRKAPRTYFSYVKRLPHNLQEVHALLFALLGTALLLLLISFGDYVITQFFFPPEIKNEEILPSPKESTVRLFDEIRDRFSETLSGSSTFTSLLTSEKVIENKGN